MVNAIVLLNVQSDRINQVAEELAGFDGISEVYSVAGQYDLVAMIRALREQGDTDLVTVESEDESFSHTMTGRLDYRWGEHNVTADLRRAAEVGVATAPWHLESLEESLELHERFGGEVELLDADADVAEAGHTEGEARDLLRGGG